MGRVARKGDQAAGTVWGQVGRRAPPRTYARHTAGPPNAVPPGQPVSPSLHARPNNLRQDLVASVVMLFLALPFSLGVALASGTSVGAAPVAIAVATPASLGLHLTVATIDLPDRPFALGWPRPPRCALSAWVGGALAIGPVASTESLLGAVAVGRLHDGPRARLDRELLGQGAANLWGPGPDTSPAARATDDASERAQGADCGQHVASGKKCRLTVRGTRHQREDAPPPPKLPPPPRVSSLGLPELKPPPPA